MPPADDRPAPLEPDLDTDEGLEAFLLGIRRPVPERLRYPETPEAYAKMVDESLAQIDRGEFFTLEEVRAHFAARFAEIAKPE